MWLVQTLDLTNCARAQLLPQIQNVMLLMKGTVLVIFFSFAGLRMAREAWRAATMIGGLFIYNHKGEVLISRVYRDDIGWVLGVKFVLSVLAVSFQCRKRDLVLVFGVSCRCVLKINLWKIIYILKEEHHVRPWRPRRSDLSDYRLFPELFISGYQLYCSRWHRKEHRKCRS